jgi:hypothetical protein
MSTTRIKKRNTANNTSNPLLFGLPLATLQHWFLRHEEVDQDAIGEIHAAITQLMNDDNYANVVFASGVIWAQYFATVGEGLDQSSDCFRSFKHRSFKALLPDEKEGPPERESVPVGGFIN